MNLNKKIIFVVVGIVIFVGAAYFITPSGNVESLTESEETTTKDEEDESEQIIMHMEDGIELLNQEIKELEQSLFDAERYIYNTELANDYLPFPDSEILYKEVQDTQYLILFTHKQDNELLFGSKELGFNAILSLPPPDDGISVANTGVQDYHYFGGLITNNEIKEVEIIQNVKFHHKADIFQVDEDTYGWYIIVEDGRLENKDDQFKIKALNQNHEVVWDHSI
ncbi:hypothetical protein [Oceanobacillus luteolus]|uniref:Uncharacterized protein n=1 Tax=Oceanobacillus luteolus TaxID=1274358 RepID=A0ABW4HR17_9BACI